MNKWTKQDSLNRDALWVATYQSVYQSVYWSVRKSVYWPVDESINDSVWNSIGVVVEEALNEQVD